MNHTYRSAITFQCTFAGSLLLLAANACSSQGSDFGKSADATGAGGANAGSSSDATSGSTTTTGGNTTGGSGGDPTGSTVTGGSTTSAGGANPTGAGGATATGGSGVGGAGGVGTGGAGMGGAGTGTGGAGGAGGSAMPACPKPAGGICHEFVANDNANNKINYINEFTSTKPGGVVWSVGVGDTGVNSPRTIEIVNNPNAKSGKAVLVSLNKGYAEFDLVDGTNLARVANTTNVTGACRMPDGNTALGAYPIIKIVSPTGASVRQFNLPTGDNLRAINRNPSDGTSWLSLTG